jgi:hypothetical protein
MYQHNPTTENPDLFATSNNWGSRAYFYIKYCLYRFARDYFFIPLQHTSIELKRLYRNKRYYRPSQFAKWTPHSADPVRTKEFLQGILQDNVNIIAHTIEPLRKFLPIDDPVLLNLESLLHEIYLQQDIINENNWNLLKGHDHLAFNKDKIIKELSKYQKILQALIHQ